MTQTVTGDVKWTLPCVRCGLVVTEDNWFPGNPQKHYDTFTCIRLLRAEVKGLQTENVLLRNVVSTSGDLIAAQQRAAASLYDPEHPIRISRREAMELSVETRAMVMARMTDAFMDAMMGEQENVIDLDDLPHTCGECGEPLTHVRPGKWQCNYCEAKEAAKA